LKAHAALLVTCALEWKQKMKLSPVRKRMLAVTAGLIGWLALMCSPFGHYIAIGTILVLIVVLFVIGCIDIHQPSGKL
jgi:hypothetical protein